MDRVAGQYAIYGLDDVILNTEGQMQMMYNISCYVTHVNLSSSTLLKDKDGMSGQE